MKNINYYPEGVETIKLVDENVNVIFLPSTTKRLEIGYAPKLKKIVSFSPELVIGPENKRADIPALNHCSNLLEIITFGSVRFNTMLPIDGEYRECAWTTVGKDGVYELEAPVLTTIGSAPEQEFPFYYYDLNAPVDEPRLEYYYPNVRTCPAEATDFLLDSAIRDVDSVTTLKKEKQLKLEPQLVIQK